jgi:hypothetical protein
MELITPIPTLAPDKWYQSNYLTDLLRSSAKQAKRVLFPRVFQVVKLSRRFHHQTKLITGLS